MISGHRILLEKWNEQDNKLMSKKINNCKPRINSKEPKMFCNFSKIHTKTNIESYTEFNKRMNDLTLFKKLNEIYLGKGSKKQTSIIFNSYLTLLYFFV